MPTWLEFRSDTMTRPTAAMRQAMADAEVGDDVCEEDPTVIRLQELAARTVGTAAALFVPSGVFGNQCAIAVHTTPGDEVIASELAHVIEHESGAAGALASVQTRTVLPRNGSFLTALDVRPRLRFGDDVHVPITRLVMLENALSDGTVMPLAALAELRALADGHGIRLHLDGARLFNAALALGVEAREIVRHVHSVSFCLSKGLGAPVGSMLCGSEEFVARARRRRKVMGGGMRQVGVLAAPGILALTEGPRQLVVDHENARLLAGLLAELDGLAFDPAQVQTNMVWVEVRKAGRTGEGLVDFLWQRGLRTYPPMTGKVRFVTSSEVDADAVRLLARTVAEYLA